MDDFDDNLPVEPDDTDYSDIDIDPAQSARLFRYAQILLGWVPITEMTEEEVEKHLRGKQWIAGQE